MIGAGSADSGEPGTTVADTYRIFRFFRHSDIILFIGQHQRIKAVGITAALQCGERQPLISEARDIFQPAVVLIINTTARRRGRFNRERLSTEKGKLIDRNGQLRQSRNARF